MRKLFLQAENLRQSELGTRNIQGTNNTIINNNACLADVTFNIQGNHNLILIHPNVFFKNTSFNLYGDHHKIIIGESTRFNERGSIWAEDHHCLISIGKQSTFEGVHLSATEPNSKLLIGEDCMFSYDIDVRTGDSHSILSKTSGARTNYAKDVIFGNHIWVASHCIFIKGTRIPNYSIVGTGSLVSKAFKTENTVIAGRPAEIIRKDIEWLRERIYSNSVVGQDFEPCRVEMVRQINAI